MSLNVSTPCSVLDVAFVNYPISSVDNPLEFTDDFLGLATHVGSTTRPELANADHLETSNDSIRLLKCVLLENGLCRFANQVHWSAAWFLCVCDRFARLENWHSESLKRMAGGSESTISFSDDLCCYELVAITVECGDNAHRSGPEQLVQELVPEMLRRYAASFSQNEDRAGAVNSVDDLFFSPVHETLEVICPVAAYTT
jgi:hypothetical protein